VRDENVVGVLQRNQHEPGLPISILQHNQDQRGQLPQEALQPAAARTHLFLLNALSFCSPDLRGALVVRQFNWRSLYTHAQYGL